MVKWHLGGCFRQLTFAFRHIVSASQNKYCLPLSTGFIVIFVLFRISLMRSFGSLLWFKHHFLANYVNVGIKCIVPASVWVKIASPVEERNGRSFNGGFGDASTVIVIVICSVVTSIISIFNFQVLSSCPLPPHSVHPFPHVELHNYCEFSTIRVRCDTCVNIVGVCVGFICESVSYPTSPGKCH